MIEMAEFIGRPVSRILETEPFRQWPVERSVHFGLGEPEIIYVFKDHGLELRCSRDLRVSVIFLHPEEYGGFDQSILEIPFSWTRAQVVGRLGAPSKSGDGFIDRILGKQGAWDSFGLPEYTIHVQYAYDADQIHMITLMRNDVVPS